VLDDLQPIAAKTGALGSAETIHAIHERAQRFNFPLVVDPVMVSKHGDSLIPEGTAGQEVIQAYRQLMPRAFLVTPNRFELEQLTGIKLNSTQDVAKAIHDLHQMGARFVLAKMGDVNGNSEHILGSGQENIAIQTKRIDTQNTHGAGCVLSALITAMIALGETNLKEVVQRAIRQISIGIHNTHPIGKGRSPVETRVLENEPV
jgi:hydroxymethylpyrimidine/phosphomethylpyrimidine kinase